jgi:hypothetical protein
MKFDLAASFEVNGIEYYCKLHYCTVDCINCHSIIWVLAHM